MYRGSLLLLVNSLVTSAIWMVNDLIAAVGSVGRSAALKALLMWVDHGVLKEDEEGIFRLLETAEERSASASDHIRQGQWAVLHRLSRAKPDPHSMQYRSPKQSTRASTCDGRSAATRRTNEDLLEGSYFLCDIKCLLNVFSHSQFIEGMLTNLGPLPLDKIQSMMKLAPGYDRTTEQLAAFLEAARREGLLAGHDGVWRLNT
jgi:anaphase-promoting complex subunit 2